MTGFLASNVYAGHHPKPQHSFLHQRKPLYWFIRPGLLHWFRDRNSQLLHPTGNSALVLLIGKATLLLRFSLLFTSKILQWDVSSSNLLWTCIQFPWCTSLCSTLTEEYHLSRVVSDYLAFVCHAFGFMHFGDLWNFLDLSHRFYKFQVLLTELLQCSIARWGPSKTASLI